MLSRCHFFPRLLQFSIVASFDCKAAFCSGVNLMSPSNRSWFSKSSSAVGKDYHLTLLHAFTYKEVQMHLIYVFTSCLVMIIKLYSMKNPWKCSMVLCCYLNVVMSLLLPTCMAYVSTASCHNQLLFVWLLCVSGIVEAVMLRKAYAGQDVWKKPAISCFWALHMWPPSLHGTKHDHMQYGWEHNTKVRLASDSTHNSFWSWDGVNFSL